MWRPTAWAVLLPLVCLAGGCDDDPCQGKTCSGHGSCVVQDGTPICECDEGYLPSPSNLECGIVAYKPIIYLYPPQLTPVTVRFGDGAEELLTHSYPAYGPDGWEVVAAPDGTLYDPDTQRQYYGLYWEGAVELDLDFTRGFVVQGTDTAGFLERRLTELGLSWREANEFIIYWLPRMERNPYNLIHFYTTEWNALVPLDIEPPPDTLIRVYMVFRGLQRPLEIEPQALVGARRTGFVVVEWGGSEL